MVEHIPGQHVYLNRGDTKLTIPRGCTLIVEPGGSLTINGVTVSAGGGALTNPVRIGTEGSSVQIGATQDTLELVLDSAASTSEIIIEPRPGQANADDGAVKLVVRSESGVGRSDNGANLELSTGNGDTSKNGGDMLVQTGEPGGADVVSGSLQVRTGSGVISGGGSGNLTIATGSAAVDQTAGNVQIEAGAAGGTGTNGDVYIAATGVGGATHDGAIHLQINSQDVIKINRASLIIVTVPTSDPAVAGALYTTANVLKVSTG